MPGRGLANFYLISGTNVVLPGQRLVGGKDSIEHAWPWTGQLLFDLRHQCGCVLIDPNFVLTAAHCFFKSRKPERYRVLLGGHKIYSGQLFQVRNISIHLLYHSFHAGSYDVAILRIDRPAPIDRNISTVCLPMAPPVVYKMCVVTGWGRIQEKGPSSKVLQEIHIPIMPTHLCNNFLHYRGLVHTPSEFCAGYNIGKVDSCQGDSGGPLVCRNLQDTAWELQGLVSWGIGCGQPGYPGIYTKVFNMLPWIRLQMLLL
uniref:Peptidase S1 domain-containing protein n=1 Tax=Acrobeloides nanus TaxID=290746 RepID=A0A914DR65_9BILA